MERPPLRVRTSFVVTTSRDQTLHRPPVQGGRDTKERQVPSLDCQVFLFPLRFVVVSKSGSYNFGGIILGVPGKGKVLSCKPPLYVGTHPKIVNSK